MTVRALGWQRPEAQHYERLRYAGVKATKLFRSVEPPDAADATALVKILDQGALGSCTTNAIAQIIRAQMIRTGAPETTEFLARLWAYTLALSKDGNLGQDVGTHLCTVMDCLAQYGFPPDSAWPYDVIQFGQKPPLGAWHAAFAQRAKDGIIYNQITEDGCDRIWAVRQALAEGYLVAFGTPVTKEFCGEEPIGVITTPQPGQAIAGGHAMCWCGYKRDPMTGRWIFRTANSWGPDWGDDGFFWMDQDYLAWERTADIWVATTAPHFPEAT